ncbi:ABC transporter ATP-binding protein [Actinospica durhamensis]|uniref:ABC transporter ATP-binding protein n=1 Tax=Actinospica durhamensis TaxID=1508375 RepID=A0A941IVQ7_9ACTN|nr:ABC transporter ATP-binding protein [Actinospica durhamensis]MBR7837611.1 ABC transporter ATP-binding protein [Actinospica durhamensis]
MSDDADPPDPAARRIPAATTPLARLRGREEWKFFAVLPRASRPLCTTWWVLTVLRGVLPGLFTVTVAALVSAVDRGAPPTAPILAAGAVFIAIQLLAPVHGQVSVLLGERLSRWLHDRLLRATTRPSGLAHLESRELADRLTAARDFDLGIAGPPMDISMNIVAGGLVGIVSGLSQAAVLVEYAWWAPLLLGGAWASTHWLLRESSIWGERDEGEVREAQRHAEYAYRQAVDSAAAKELRLFGLSEWTVARFTASRERLVDLRWTATRLRRKPLRTVILVLVAANGLFLWTLARSAQSGTVDVGQITAFVQAAMGTSALAFGGLSWALPPAAHSVDTVLALEAEMAAVGDLDAGAPAPVGASVVAAPGLAGAAGAAAHGSAGAAGAGVTLRLRGVRFTYPGSTRPVLDGLDLTVEAGTSLAVVGVNGAGKTTLAKLVCGLYRPTGGVIEADDVDLRTVDVLDWRRRVTAVFQDFIRYDLPLRTNVAPLGAPDAAITAALAAAGADGLTGLDTPLGRGYEGATELSGGQWQRVAVARALCAVGQGAGVVVLDEPTAQLDVRGETEIFERILRATRGCTTLLISHRFSTVRRADRICVLEDGRVAELGTHDELMARGGRYRRMFDLQASRFVAEETDEPVH